MNQKTIRKVIHKKMTDWLLSIQDIELRNKVRANLMVSGGCIANMLLGQDVNDYDVYIKDRDVLVKLCDYYIKSFNLPFAVIHKDMDEKYLKELGINDERLGINGSVTRNLQDGNVRLYDGNGRTAGKPIEKPVLGEEARALPENAKWEQFYPVYVSPNAISLSDDIQIVVRFHGDHEEIHKNYDFIHATNYFTMNDGLVLNTEAMTSLITKTLKYQGSKYPITSILRMKKFIKRGFNIGAGEVLRIIMQISDLDLKNPDVLEEQLVGVDVAYFGKVIEILRGLDPNTSLTSSYVNTIIERVFSEFDENENVNETNE